MANKKSETVRKPRSNSAAPSGAASSRAKSAGAGGGSRAAASRSRGPRTAGSRTADLAPGGTDLSPSGRGGSGRSSSPRSGSAGAPRSTPSRTGGTAPVKPATKTRSSGTKSPAAKSPSTKTSASTPNRPWLLYGTAAIALGVLAIGGLAGVIDGYGRSDQATRGKREGAQAIVVLGAHVNESGQPGNSLMARARHAAALYQQGIASHIVCSGGIGQNPPSEAQAAASFIERQGVPRSAVLLEDKSTSTWENARFTARLCREHGWKKVVVVSEPFHLYRARRDFQKAGLTPYMSPATSSRLAQTRLRSLFYTLREALLLIRDMFR